MNTQQALLRAVTTLQNSESTSVHLDAEVLLSFVTGKPKGYLLAYPEKKLTNAQQKKFGTLITKRKRGTPIAYLTGQQEFYKLNFFVTKDTLIPRPETETLIEHTIKQSRELINQQDKKKTIIIADIGTGSGCIAVTLAKYLPQTKVVATDVSTKALTIAKKNARQHEVFNKVMFVQGDLLQPWLRKKGQKSPPKPDIIVANLPYLTKNELHNVPYEPQEALYGGKMGLELIEKLLFQSATITPNTFAILLEIGPGQIEGIKYITETKMSDKTVQFIKDLADRHRVAIIK